MRVFLNLISVSIIIIVAYFASLNTQNVDFVLKGSHHFSFAYIVLAIFLLGLLSGIICTSSFCIPLTKKLKEYQRKLEKTSVQTDEESSKVSVLEAKIETLERALDSTLKKNNN